MENTIQSADGFPRCFSQPSRCLFVTAEGVGGGCQGEGQRALEAQLQVPGAATGWGR